MRDLRGFRHRRQQTSDRYDALDEACVNLRWAIEALREGGVEGCEDDAAALEDIAAGLNRERENVSRQLDRMDAADRAAMDREYRRSAL